MQLEKRGDQMMGFDSVKKYVEWLAKENGVTKERDKYSLAVDAVARVTGDYVELDDTQILLINLKNSGVLSSKEHMHIAHKHIIEKKKH